ALAKERAVLVPVERPARLGDVVTLDYEGSIDGEPFEGGRGSGETVELHEGRFIPGFATGIAGMHAGETKTIEAAFPQDYPSAHVAGKTALFRVTLREVKEPELPSLDDTFARTISDDQTIVQLRADIRRRLEAAASGRARRVLGNAIIAQLVGAHDFPLPASMVEREIDRLIEDRGRQSSDTDLRESLRADAESRVRAALLIGEIAKIENITATPADVSAELEALGRRYGQPVDRVRKALGNNLLSLMDGIERNKTLDFLIDNAEVVNEETSAPAS
ncbi:MAG: trigger factor, partial [Candidatus Eremiobacteraeota bacterium]|nr:trigger factor [Candidatus Eremiobacteraeota bacterium]